MIYVNGDSYSAEGGGHRVWSDFLQHPVKNKSLQGSNNDRIFRSSIEDLLVDNYTHAIIGFSFVCRKEIWYNGDKNLKQLKQRNLWDGNSETRFDTDQRYCNHKLVDEDIKQLISNKHQCITKDFSDFIHSLVTFVCFLKSQNIKYLLFRAAEEPDMQNMNWDYIKNTQAWNYLAQDPNILDFDFSIPKFARDRNLETTSTGHMYESGHKKFAEFVTQYV